MTRTLLATAALAALLAGCGTADPLPEEASDFPSAETTTTQAAPAPAPPPVEEPAAASTCEVAREAFLTGTQAQIDAALEALVADTGADATARENAQSYLETDDGQLKSMYQDLVQMSCTF